MGGKEDRKILEELLDSYTLDGRKDAITGEIDFQLSLRHLMAECMNFQNEETALQYLGTPLGVTVELTPKFHAKLAGKHVEYSWAHAKAFYRQVPVSRKRVRDNFKAVVKECIALPCECFEQIDNRKVCCLGLSVYLHLPPS